MRRLSGRVAVVTGAASGIGRETSLALARQGCQLVLADRDAAQLEETATQVRQLGREASAHTIDVADKGQMEAFARAVGEQHGEVHVLVNNAGVTVTSRFEDHSLDDWEWIVGVNLWGVVYGCHFFLPLLKRADEAHIVNVSSVFGLLGVPAQSSYCATKFAVRGLSEALWVELRQHGIGVTCVHPGAVRTGIARSGRSNDQVLADYGQGVIERARVTPAQCAAAIVDAVQRGRMTQFVAAETYVIDGAKRLLPGITQRLLQLGYARRRF